MRISAWPLHHGARGFLVSHAGLVWALLAALSVITARHLLVEHNGRCPLHLLTLQLVGFAVFKLATARLRGKSRDRAQPSIQLEKTSSTRRKAVLVADALSYALALPLFSLALVKFPSTAVLCMLALSVFAFPVLLSILNDASVWIVLLRLCIFVMGMWAIIRYEYRLTADGPVLGYLAFASFGLLQSLCRLLYRRSGLRPRIQGLDSALASLFAIGVSCVAAVTTEDPGAAVTWVRQLDTQLLAVLALNLLSTVAVLALGKHLLTPNGNAGGNQSLGLARPSSVLAILCMVAVVDVSMTYNEISITHPFQLLGCLIAGASIVDIDAGLMRSRPVSGSAMFPFALRTRRSDSGVDVDQDSPWNSKHMPAHPETDRRRTALSKVLLFTTLALWLACLLSACDTLWSPSYVSQDATLDSDFRPTAGFDIVVSIREHEEPFGVINALEHISSIPSIEAVNSRLFIYTKDNSIDISAVLEGAQPFYPTSSVVLIPNQGSHSETYLFHILTHWDTLASHTLFLRASEPYTPEVHARLANFYLPSTGVLPLDISSSICLCGSPSCSDGTWSDSSGVISDTYLQATGHDTCAPGERLLLSPTGQFVASAARIRGTPRRVYRQTRRWLTDAQAWVHREPYLSGRADSVAEPVFGPTMDRLWPGLLQCAAGHVAKYCPSLRSGWRAGGSVQDCQCMDEGGEEREPWPEHKGGWLTGTEKLREDSLGVHEMDI